MTLPSDYSNYYYEQLYNSLTFKLRQKGISESASKPVLDTLEEILLKEQDTAFTSSWCVEDVMGAASEFNYDEDLNKEELSREDAKKILGMMCGNHDANIGTSWDTISCMIDMYLDDKKKCLKQNTN